jgi:hypothetical protein
VRTGYSTIIGATVALFSLINYTSEGVCMSRVMLRERLVVISTDLKRKSKP